MKKEEGNSEGRKQYTKRKGQKITEMDEEEVGRVASKTNHKRERGSERE